MNKEELEPQSAQRTPSFILAQLLAHLCEIPWLQVREYVPLKELTRFAVGGPARILAETAYLESFVQAVDLCRSSALPCCLIGEGSNLVAGDRGFDGVVLRWTARSLRLDSARIKADAGAPLQELVSATVRAGLRGLETLAGIPGSVGAAIYGNAGAYGHSISERVAGVQYLDRTSVQDLDGPGCGFQYRESLFKQHKDWFILNATLQLEPGEAAELCRIADEITAERNHKFPPDMKCAGSIFKNLLAAGLPPGVRVQVPPAAVREGKIPAGWFLEQVGAKGLHRGDIHVAGHHANLLYNAGAGTAADLRALIEELKLRVRTRYGTELEEEVQYLGDF